MVWSPKVQGGKKNRKKVGHRGDARQALEKLKLSGPREKRNMVLGKIHERI